MALPTENSADTRPPKERFSADLTTILDVAQNRIPALADAIADTNAAVAGTQDLDDAAFSRQSNHRGDGTEVSAVGQAWSGLRNTYQMLLAMTQQNLQDTAAALVDVVNHYSRTDGYNAQDLTRHINEEYNPDAATDPAIDTVEPPGSDGRYEPPRSPRPDYGMPADQVPWPSEEPE